MRIRPADHQHVIDDAKHSIAFCSDPAVLEKAREINQRKWKRSSLETLLVRRIKQLGKVTDAVERIPTKKEVMSKKTAKEIIVEVGEPREMTRGEIAKHAGIVAEPGKREAKQLIKLYREAQNGMRRIIALGMYCHHIKEQLAHKEFLPWIESNCKGVSYRSVATYMAMTVKVVEASGLQMCSTLHICNSGKSLLLPDKKVSAEAKPVHEKIFAMIDGKSQRQLMLEFREADEEPAKLKGGGKKLDGGFAPSKSMLTQWQEANAPEFAGKKFDVMPKAAQKAFKEFWRVEAAKPDPKADGEQARSMWNDIAQKLSAQKEMKYWAHLDKGERNMALILLQSLADDIKQSLKD